jgi:hypothetical protein
MALLWRIAVAATTAAVTMQAQHPQNLVRNGDASAGLNAWDSRGPVTIEGTGPGIHFVVTNEGRLTQVIDLPASATRQFVAVVGRGAGDRVHPDGSITGLPSLSGQFGDVSGTHFFGELFGYQMVARPPRAGVWVVMGNAFQIPDGTRRLFLHLQQAARQADPRTGAAARFDDIGVFLFPTEAQARALIADWPSPAAVYLEPPATLSTPPDPLSVLRGSRSGELLAPPADPAPVTPFVPEWGAVLPAIEGFKVARPCSRRRPDKVMDVWTPDRDVIARFDRELAPLVQGALERSPMPRKPTWSSGSYYRQYVGLVIDNRRIVYANAFLPLVTPRTPTGVSDTWQTQIVNACDGGERFFGAEFDVESGRVKYLAFNSPR